MWTNRAVLEVSSAAPDSTPVWVDISAYMLDEAGWSVTSGRQSPLDNAQPARLSLALNNADHRFTPGNTSSPYFPWFTQSCRIRLRETIGPVTFEHFEGFIEMPDVVIDLPDVDQVVTVNAIDRLGRLQAGRRFRSALAEYIRNTVDLKGYWPLDGAGPPFGGYGPYSTPVSADRHYITSPSLSEVRLQAQAGTAPPGGESNGVRVSYTDPNNISPYIQLGVPTGSTLYPLGGDVGTSATVVFWVAVTDINYATQNISSWLIDGNANSIIISLDRSHTTGVWTLSAGSAMSGSITGPAPGGGTLMPVGMRVSPSAATMELWVGGQRYTGTLTGTPPVNMRVNQTFIGGGPCSYDASHLQIYAGSTYSYNDFKEQIKQGYNPLERQYTGDRIRAIAAYAGVPSGEVDADRGVVQMSRVSLAGKSPLDAMLEAETAEQGRLSCRGPRVTFRDRRRKYDI